VLLLALEKEEEAAGGEEGRASYSPLFPTTLSATHSLVLVET